MDYKPLSKERKEIRVVRIHPCVSNDDVITCTLKTVSLSEYSSAYSTWSAAVPSDIRYTRKTQSEWSRHHRGDHDNEQGYSALIPSNAEYRYNWGDYSALSYCWGDESLTENIILNGILRPVGINLRAALKTLRTLGRFNQDYMIWVDAVCINQNDIQERNQQVSLMSKIYTFAWCVTPWLGLETDRSNQAIDFLHTLSVHWPDYSKLARNAEDNLDIFPAGSFMAVYAFVWRPYWSRLWIKQELALGHSHTTFLCGTKEISLKTLIKSLSIVRGLPYGLLLAQDRVRCGVITEGMAWSILSDLITLLELSTQFQENGPSISSWDLINAVRSSDCKDPRDRLYGVLGLMHPTISDQIVHDYEKSASEAYASFLEAYIRTQGDAEILLLAGSLTSRTRPTWAPTWGGSDYQFRHKLVVVEPYNAFPEDAPLPFVFPEGRGRLVCTGVVFDAIDGIGNRFFQSRKVTNSTRRSHGYGTDEKAKSAFVRMLTTGRNEDGMTISEEELFPEDNLAASATPSSDSSSVNYWNEYCSIEYNWLICGKTFGEYVESCSRLTAHGLSLPMGVINRFSEHFYGRNLMTTREGLFGWVAATVLEPDILKAGDLICAISGCSMPLVIRPYEDGFELLGECYVQGRMEGELAKDIESKTLEVCQIVLY